MVEQPSSLAPVACGEESDVVDELEDEDEDEEGVSAGVLGVLLDEVDAGGGVEELEEDVLEAGETVGALPPPHAVMPNRATTPAEVTARRPNDVCIARLFR
ncbi:MAG: hypothetical protein ABI360_01105 [Allobranchiibius sp.]